ncbi:hypothetical protein [Adhaeribacter soli]|uniref:Uncharacterized protein n=1 Tax=Adhaeribacter soli TaxID=2607655 RepID=A0A5N1IMF7_9BACT|nr:hypothetical protein [Adhaeribacter soli]KAA9324981.1 hypothetical protein F0P94_18900 [Adhaeribacter soli]
MGKEKFKIKVTSARKVYELLELVRQKPYFLTSKSITALQDFLNGYMQLGFADDIYNSGDPNFEEFKYWILNKDKEVEGTSNPFSRVLLKECDGDEERAFEKFFVYLAEFKLENR